VWGDSADIDGKIFVGTPIETAAAIDASLGVHGRSYEEVARRALASNECGYHVYRADVNGGEAVPVVQDGLDEETIQAVERDCEYVTSIRCVDTAAVF
jgi:hypothetical protein